MVKQSFSLPMRIKALTGQSLAGFCRASRITRSCVYAALAGNAASLEGLRKRLAPEVFAVLFPELGASLGTKGRR